MNIKMSGTVTAITVPDTKITNSVDILQSLLDVPDKSAETEVLVGLVLLTESVQDRGDLLHSAVGGGARWRSGSRDA